MAFSCRIEDLPSNSSCMKILSAYRSGCPVISSDTRYVVVGRDKEAEQFIHELKYIEKTGSGVINSFIGRFGIGKTFLMKLFQNLAIDEKFIVMTADLSRNTWFYGTKSEKQGVQLYRRLIYSTSIDKYGFDKFDDVLQQLYQKVSEDSEGSLDSIINTFCEQVQPFSYCDFFNDIKNAIIQRFKELYTYEEKSDSLHYFYADYTTRIESRKINVEQYITDSNWFDVLGTLSKFFTIIGYKGIVIEIDQLEYLLQLPPNKRRENYEFIQMMRHKISCGMVEGISLQLFASNQLIDDPIRGIGTYPALFYYFNNSYHLSEINIDNRKILLQILTKLHEKAYSWDSKINLNEIDDFLSKYEIQCRHTFTFVWIRYLDEKLYKND